MHFAKFISCLVLSAGALSLTGCDWSSGGSSLNTSKGAGVNINFSGVYDGNLDGGKAVSKTSNGNILRLVISQSGNLVQVSDNQGSHYEGTVGSPGIIAQPDSTGAYPVGAELVQAQINFSGHDNVAQRDIQFVGVIHAVSVSDIKGESSVTTNSSGSSSTSSDTDTSTDTYTYNTSVTVSTNVVNGQTITTTESAYDPNGKLVFQQVTVETIAPSGDKTTTTQVITDTRTTSSGNSSNEGTANSTVTTTTFQVTEANTQYRLEGNWIEDGGNASTVDALSPGTAGVITTTAESATTTPTPTAQVTFFQ